MSIVRHKLETDEQLDKKVAARIGLCNDIISVDWVEWDSPDSEPETGPQTAVMLEPECEIQP